MAQSRRTFMPTYIAKSGSPDAVEVVRKRRFRIRMTTILIVPGTVGIFVSLLIPEGWLRNWAALAVALLLVVGGVAYISSDAPRKEAKRLYAKGVIRKVNFLVRLEYWAFARSLNVNPSNDELFEFDCARSAAMKAVRHKFEALHNRGQVGA